MYTFLIILFIAFILINIKKSPSFTEYSTKFSKDKINDKRVVYGYNTLDDTCTFNDIVKNHNIDKKTINFYNSLFAKDEDDITEIIYGFDGKKSKLYVNSNNYIYGIEKNNLNYSLRIYEPYLFDKKALDAFIGTEKSNIFCRLFKVKNNSIVYTKRNQNDNFKMNCINFAITKYQIKDYKKEILRMLHIFNLCSQRFEEWFNSNKNQYIYWIAINKSDKENSEPEYNITFYYRKS